MLSRKMVRDMTYKLIFQYLFTGNSYLYETYSAMEMTEADAAYMERVYFGVIEHREALCSEVERYAKNFKLERINRADLAALLLALYEMHYESEIPINVSISEAVELVKLYSTEKSHQFVNGILSAVCKDMLKTEGEE